MEHEHEGGHEMDMGPAGRPEAPRDEFWEKDSAVETAHKGHPLIDEGEVQAAPNVGHSRAHGGHLPEHVGHNQDPSNKGHDRHAGHSVAMFRQKFWLSLVLTLPVIFWSHDVGMWLSFTAPTFPGSAYIPQIFGLIVFLYGGPVFLRGAYRELLDRKPGMMTLIGLAISVAFLASSTASLGYLKAQLWWELATLITIMLLGHWQEMRAIGQAQGALGELAKLIPDTAERLRPGGNETVPVSALKVGDVILVRPGGRVPADGLLMDGSAEVDESMITGESRSVPKSDGSQLIAGTVLLSGSAGLRVMAVGKDTALSGIMRLVAEAQSSASRAQDLADRAAAWLFYIALGTGALTFLYWWAAGDATSAVSRTVTVLVIACPHALGLAIPLVIAISTALGASRGLLIKDRIALERARELGMVIFDKTGTLTLGKPVLSGLSAKPGGTEDGLLALAAAVDARSEHPLARAISEAAGKKGLKTPDAVGFSSVPGRGAEASVDGRKYAIGGSGLLHEKGFVADQGLAAEAAVWSSEGRTVLYLLSGEGVIGALALEDEVRPESAAAVRSLHRLGVKVAMLTGDSPEVAEAVARKLGIDEVAAGVLPAGKAEVVRRFQEGGRKVAMVGDGVNDAPALAAADVGIAIGAGTAVAVESAGIVLVRDDPRGVVSAIALSRATYRKMVENLAWATGYNLLAIPVAAGILVPWGISLPMSVGAIAMSASTVIVAMNAQLLRRLKL